MYTSAWGEPTARDLTHCLDSVAFGEPLSLTGSGCSLKIQMGTWLSPGRLLARPARSGAPGLASPGKAAGGVDSDKLRLAAPRDSAQ